MEESRDIEKERKKRGIKVGTRFYGVCFSRGRHKAARVSLIRVGRCTRTARAAARFYTELSPTAAAMSADRADDDDDDLVEYYIYIHVNAYTMIDEQFLQTVKNNLSPLLRLR